MGLFRKRSLFLIPRGIIMGGFMARKQFLPGARMALPMSAKLRARFVRFTLAQTLIPGVFYVPGRKLSNRAMHQSGNPNSRAGVTIRSTYAPSAGREFIAGER